MLSILLMSLQGWPLAFIIIAVLLCIVGSLIFAAILKMTEQRQMLKWEIETMRKTIIDYQHFAARFDETMAKISADNQKAVSEMVNKVIGL